MARRKHSKQRTVAETTLLVVGEGADDKAFINHMKGLFFERKRGHKGPKIEAADGGSPHDILKHATKLIKNRDYERRIVVMDSDQPVEIKDQKAAEQAGFEIILWSPQCLEGALLNTLGEAVNSHETSQNLKARLHPRLACNHTEPEAYGVLFTKSVLENPKNKSVKDVKNVIAPKPKKPKDAQPV
jgi:hypothetical protein